MQVLRRSAPPVTAELLAEETGVSKRTLYRDIETLRGMGAVIDGATGFGYTLIEDASLPPLTFDDEEIEALVVGLREVQAVADPALAKSAASALAKLQSRLPDAQARRMQHAVLSAHRFERIPQPGVDASILRKAAWDEMQVSFDYIDKFQASTRREVQPLGIVFMDNAHCLLAWCLLRDDFRAFRLDRMATLSVTKTSFRPKRAAMLRTYLARITTPAENCSPQNWRVQSKADPG